MVHMLVCFVSMMVDMDVCRDISVCDCVRLRSRVWTVKASGHAGLAVCSCCGSVRLFGREAAVSVCVCVCAAHWLRSVYVCNRHLTTQTQQAAKEKRQRRRSAALTASS